MRFFGAKPKLLSALSSLALYNDKGIAWSRHTPQQSLAERVTRITKVRELAYKLGRDELPPEFFIALDSGEIATDGTGQHVAAVEAHFRRSKAV